MCMCVFIHNRRHWAAGFRLAVMITSWSNWLQKSNQSVLIPPVYINDLFCYQRCWNLVKSPEALISRDSTVVRGRLTSLSITGTTCLQPVVTVWVLEVLYPAVAASWWTSGLGWWWWSCGRWACGRLLGGWRREWSWLPFWSSLSRIAFVSLRTWWSLLPRGSWISWFSFFS
jgi:hypothetical protein